MTWRATSARPNLRGLPDILGYAGDMLLKPEAPVPLLPPPRACHTLLATSSNALRVVDPSLVS